jgi:GTPase SAR1 family protein
MGGQGRYRDLWHRFYTRSDAVVLVVDGNDVKRLGTLRDEFHRVVHHPGKAS